MTDREKSMEYLTDKELEHMLLNLENDLIPAPPDLQERILEQVRQEKVAEFKRYRFRVLTTVAAAVLVIFLLPGYENPGRETEFVKNPRRQEYLWQERYETKEQALNDKGVLETLFGGVNIFANNDKWNLFR